MSGISGVNSDLAMLAAMQGAPAPAAPKDVVQAVKTARDFESVLLHKVMEEMQKTVPDSGLLEDGTSQQVQGIFWFHLAQEMAQQGGVGLWKDVYRQMTGQAPPASVEQLR